MPAGLKKLFYNLSLASRKVEERREARDKLRGYIRKIRIVAERSPKKSAVHEEIKNLEANISDLLDKKLKYLRPSITSAEREGIEAIKHKERELTDKISKLNELLAKVGKKVDENSFPEELMEGKEEPSMIEQLEEKLYTLESKYLEMESNPEYPDELLNRVREKISVLKERIRQLK